jgi:hypothetical protein
MLKRLIRFFRPLQGAWVRVHVTAGAPSVEGEYMYRRGGYVFIDTPTVLPDAGEDKKLGGQLAIPRERINFVQRMPQ